MNIKKLLDRTTVLASALVLTTEANAAPTYSVGGVSEELRQVLIEDAKEYGLTFEYSAEHWRTIVKEKDIREYPILRRTERNCGQKC